MLVSNVQGDLHMLHKQATNNQTQNNGQPANKTKHLSTSAMPGLLVSKEIFITITININKESVDHAPEY